MKNFKKYCKMLELDKIFRMISEFAHCDETKQLVKNLKPSSNLTDVKRLVGQTDEAFVMMCRFGNPEFIAIFSPIESLNRAAAGISMNLHELLNVGRVFRQSRFFKTFFKKSPNGLKYLNDYIENLTLNDELERLIFKSILSDETISDDASLKLKALRNSFRKQQQKIRDILEALTKGSSQKYLQDNIITMRDNRYVVPVKIEYKNEIPGLIHDVSSSGSTVFIEPSNVVSANNELRVILAREKEEISRILADLTSKCLDFSEAIKQNYNNILQLDLIFSKAKFSIEINATMPEIVDDGQIYLKNARHPLIDKKLVVPINIELGKKFKSLIITGPNTGGKTVALKTVGLLTLMVMSGLLIPVSEGSKISVFSHILVDIGDGQSIENSLSTFSSHMTNIVSILQDVDDRSLVLIDELGSGTDPEEGAALAVAIVENISAKNARLIATTHYTELKMYALEKDDVENACFEFDIKHLAPTYNLMIGVPGQSNAFAISQKMGLDPNLIHRAQELLSSQKSDFIKIVNKFEILRKEYEKKLQIQNQEMDRIEKLKREMDIERENLSKKINRDLDKAQEKARYIVDGVRAESNRILNQLKEIKKRQDKKNIDQLINITNSVIKNSVDNLYEKANPVIIRQNEQYLLPRNLKIGDNVLIYDIDKTGEVLSEPDRSGKVLVRMGQINMRVELKNLRLMKKTENKKKISKLKKSLVSKSARKAATEIDLRGQNVEEALTYLDRFIDQCILSNIENITIIHGKGTGTLRKSVNSHLKNHPNVCEKRLGVFGEGEDGVTIVRLK